MNVLEKLIKLEQEADNFGFRWENHDQIMAQIHSEYLEINANLKNLSDDADDKALQEEIGDLLHAVFSLCVFCQLNPQETLKKAVSKFERRLKTVKEIAGAQGLKNLKGYSFDELMGVWDKAKERVG